MVVRGFGVRFVRGESIRGFDAEAQFRYMKPFLQRHGKDVLQTSGLLCQAIYKIVRGKGKTPQQTTASGGSITAPRATSTVVKGPWRSEMGSAKEGIAPSLTLSFDGRNAIVNASFHSAGADGTEAEAEAASSQRNITGCASPSLVRPVLSSNDMAVILAEAHERWHEQFFRDYLMMNRCSFLDTIDHPVGQILAAGTDTEGGVQGILQAFRDMEKSLQYARDGIPSMDEELHKFYVLVHDASSSVDLDQAKKIFSVLEHTLGKNACAFITLNQAYHALPHATNRPEDGSLSWIQSNELLDSLATDGSNRVFADVSPVFGAWPDGSPKRVCEPLTADELHDVQLMMHFYLGQSLFPSLERKFRNLAETIKRDRQTAFSKVASWFRGKDDQQKRSVRYVEYRDGALSKYMSSSLEMQIRRAGDVAMMLHDYETALIYFKMLRDDLIAGLVNRPFNRPYIAAAHEAIALCYIALGRQMLPTLNSSKCYENILEMARNEYAACGFPTFTLRVALIHFELCRVFTPPACERALSMLQSLQQSRLFVTPPFASDSFITSVYCAIIHELQASCCLFLNPPAAPGSRVVTTKLENYPMRCHLRKFAQYVILAGTLYNNADLPEMALRCCLRGLQVYRRFSRYSSPEAGTSWALMYEQVHLLLTHLNRRLGHHVSAQAHEALLLLHGTPAYRDARTAGVAVEGFFCNLQQVLSLTKQESCPHLLLPLLLVGTLSVTVDRYHSDAITIKETKSIGESIAQEWRSLERHLRLHYEQQSNSNNFMVPNYDAKGRLSPNSATAFSSYSGFGDQKALPRRGDDRASGSSAAARPVRVAVMEPVTVTADLCNPVGCPLVLEDLTVLFVRRDEPTVLRRSAPNFRGAPLPLRAGESGATSGSSTTCSPLTLIRTSSNARTIPPMTTERVSLEFAPAEVGEYIIVGFAWRIFGMEGQSLFATKAVDTSGSTVRSYPMELERILRDGNILSGNLNVDAHQNIVLLVLPAVACVTATLEPPIPSLMHDGEVFHTKLILHNQSQACPASHICIQRSVHNQHTVYFEDYSLEENCDASGHALLLPNVLEPNDTHTLSLSLCAQHSTGRSMSLNNILFMIGYYPGEGVNLGDPGSPLGRNDLPPTNGRWIRMHRLLRRVKVLPLLEWVTSMALVPHQPKVRFAANVTLRNLCPFGGEQVELQEILAYTDDCWEPQIPVEHRASLKEPIIQPSTSLSIALVIGLRDRTSSGSPSSSSQEHTICTYVPASKSTRSRSIYQNVIWKKTQAGATAAVKPAAYPHSMEHLFGAPFSPSAAEGNHSIGRFQLPYFLMHAFLGSGSLGIIDRGSVQYGDGGMNFYLDKGVQVPSKMEPADATASALEEERAARDAALLEGEKRKFGGPCQHFPPLGLVVRWKRATSDVLGCTFLVLDPTQGLGMNPTVAALTVAGTAPLQRTLRDHDSALPRQVERVMLRRLARGHSLQATRSFVLSSLSSVERPREAAGGSCLVPVQLKCTSLAPIPLRIEIRAQETMSTSTRKRPQVPLFYIGKTAESVVLAPGHTWTTQLTAQVFGAGLVDLSALDIAAEVVPWVPALQETPCMLWTDYPMKDPSVNALFDTLGMRRLQQEITVVGGDESAYIILPKETS